MYWRGFWITVLAELVACGVALFIGTRYYPKLNEKSGWSQSNFQFFFVCSLMFIMIYLLILRVWLFGFPWNE